MTLLGKDFTLFVDNETGECYLGNDASATGVYENLNALLETTAGYFDQYSGTDDWDDWDQGASCEWEVKVEVYGETVTVTLVPDESFEAKYLVGNKAGKSLWPLGAYVNYDRTLPKNIGVNLRHEAFHYYEQSAERLSWYVKYGGEYLARRISGQNPDVAYWNFTDEVQARNYSWGLPIPDLPWEPLIDSLIDSLNANPVLGFLPW